jgi:two-component system, NtrC family, response regulator GlrR
MGTETSVLASDASEGPIAEPTITGIQRTLTRSEVVPPPGLEPAILRVRGLRGDRRLVCPPGQPLIVGSARRADLRIPDPTVLPRHIEVERVPGGLRFTAILGSPGVEWLGHRMERGVLGDGGVATLGRATLVVSIPGDPTADPNPTSPHFRQLRGRSFVMRKLCAELARLEQTTVPVLVTGESGVGKELVARALHESSRHADGPFVPVNCGAIPEQLIGSELFGHTRGAFTGATEPRDGAFACADGGTLFLDEIGELPIEAQPVLLRALETSEIQALGQSGSRRVQVRVVAATNRDLELAVRAGTFRQDLYYRLAVARIHVPPLRHRMEDVPELARTFAEEVGVPTLPKSVLDDLVARAWPGNVRELKNAVLSYLALGELPDADGPRDQGADDAVAPFIDVGVPYMEQKARLVDRFTHHYLAALLEHTRFNQSAAARLSGLDRGYVGRLTAKHGIRPR